MINLTFIRNNRNYFYIIIVVVVIMLIVVLNTFFGTNNQSTTITVPKGIPMYNKSLYNPIILNYDGKNFNTSYYTLQMSNQNNPPYYLHVIIKNINFSNPKDIISEEKIYMNEAQQFLKKYGVNTSSKRIIYTF